MSNVWTDPLYPPRNYRDETTYQADQPPPAPRSAQLFYLDEPCDF